MSTVKMKIKSTMPTPGDRHYKFDTKDFYLNSQLTDYLSTWIELDLVPEHITTQHQLRNLAKMEKHCLK